MSEDSLEVISSPERVSSPSPSSSHEYNECPMDTRYLINIELDEKKVKLEYFLKRGKELPYQREIKGKQFIFKKDLSLDIQDPIFEKVEEDNHCYTFRKLTGVREKEDDTSVHNSSEHNTSEYVEEIPSTVDVIQVEEVHAISTSGDLYQCRLCGIYGSNIPEIYQHLQDSHQDEWKTFSPTENQSQAESSNVPTVHLDPEYKENLKKTFVENIVPTWSKFTRDAWLSNQKLTKKSEFKAVRVEITKSLQQHVLSVFGTVKRPSETFYRDMVSDLLAVHYPYMFGQGEGTAEKDNNLNYGRDLGGKHGIKNLPNQLFNSTYRMQIQMMKDEEGIEESNEKKKPELPGINKTKFNLRANEDQRKVISETQDISSEEERQRIYSENWPAIMEMIRTSNKRPDLMVRGFFESRVHIKKSWEFLTGVTVSLEENITKNIEKQVFLMEQYLTRKDLSKDKGIIKKLADINQKVLTDYQGVQTYKQVEVIRLLAEVMEKGGGDGKGILCYEWEEPIASEPYLRVHVLPDKSFKFVLHADKVPLLEPQDLPDALASFFHLCFSFQIHYAEKAQTATVILQQFLAKYGSVESDCDLTQNKKRKKTIAGKISEYKHVIGDIILQ